ncbi:DUF6481 family protein, partial [Rhodoplanes roseus]
MGRFRDNELQDRQSNAVAAKKALLEKFKTAVADPTLEERRATLETERLARKAERDAIRAKRDAEAAEKARIEAEAAEKARVAAEAIATRPLPSTGTCMKKLMLAGMSRA